MDRITYIGWESNLSIRPQKYCLHSFNEQHQWERLNWKPIYSMILANNTKGVSSQLFGCGRVKLGPLERGHLHHLFINELLLVWPVGHMDPHTTDWTIKSRQVSWTGNLPTWMWHFNPRAIHNTLYCMWQGDKSNGERFLKNLKKREGHFQIILSLNVIFTTSELESSCISFRTFQYWFGT